MESLQKQRSGIATAWSSKGSDLEVSRGRGILRLSAFDL